MPASSISTIIRSPTPTIRSTACSTFFGADERYHPKPGSLGVDELMGSLVRTAVRQDAGNAVAPKNVEHAVERIVGVGLLIIVEMRVEDFQCRLRTASNRRGDDNDRSGDGARDYT